MVKSAHALDLNRMKRRISHWRDLCVSAGMHGIEKRIVYILRSPKPVAPLRRDHQRRS